MAKKTEIIQTAAASTPARPAPLSPEPVIETLEAKKPKVVKKVKKAKKPEVVAETPPKKQAKKPAGPTAKKAQRRKPSPTKRNAKTSPEKVVPPVKARKTSGRKPGPKAVSAKAKMVPGRKPGKKGPGLVAAVTGKKPILKKSALIGRKTDLLKMGEGAFLYSLELTQRVEEMERVIANFERMFEAVRHLFSREMDEIEELVAGLLE